MQYVVRKIGVLLALCFAILAVSRSEAGVIVSKGYAPFLFAEGLREELEILNPYLILDEEYSIPVVSKLSAKNLISLSKMSLRWKKFIFNLVQSDDYLLDLSEVSLNQEQFRDLFGETGVFSLARRILLSHKSFKSDWIEDLPYESLNPTDQGLPRLQVKTRSGAHFDYMGKHRDYPGRLGHGWRDPKRVIWYEAVREEGKILRMAQEEASQYCQVLEAELATAEECFNLGQFFDADPRWPGHFLALGFLEPKNSYYPQVLRDLDLDFWTADQGLQFLKTGFIASWLLWISNRVPFRCIIREKVNSVVSPEMSDEGLKSQREIEEPTLPSFEQESALEWSLDF